MNQFYDWLFSDNVDYQQDENGKYFFTSQDAQWCNKLYSIEDCWKYFRKEFLN